jgi:hypothetical protein
VGRWEPVLPGGVQLERDMIPHVVPIGRVENGNIGGKAITTDKYFSTNCGTE